MGKPGKHRSRKQKLSTRCNREATTLNRCGESTFQRVMAAGAPWACRCFVHTALLTGYFRDSLPMLGRICRPILLLLYHILLTLTSASPFPTLLNGLA